MDKNKISLESLNTVLVTDCGSTTTKAVLFERTESGWRQTSRGEAPTTVEKPIADVTIGARNSFKEIEELSGKEILTESESETNPFTTKKGKENGIDLYLSTSSAGGGLQMVVAGVVGNMTCESAERAALGAGAIVMDKISIDDGRELHERVQKIRHLRPDIILIAGGTEGGTINHPLELAETILQASPRPRFGETLKLPVIFAANSKAREEAKKILEETFEFVSVENIRPELEKENLAPARDAIHELFLNHVMSHAPGYKKLINWSPIPIMPTPAAVGDMVQIAAEEKNISILAVDIGGATTDVFSVFKDESKASVFNRTVSANLGMSYSVANVMLEAGIENIKRWLTFEISTEEIKDRLRNKMIRPTSIPQTIEDLELEHAVCREALRLSFIHHKRLASGLKGKKNSRSLAQMLANTENQAELSMSKIDLIIGSGGVLSHAPNRISTAQMLIDAYQPEGKTDLSVDSIFMMPHLGVFASVYPEAACEILFKDCLIDLATVIAPTGEIKNSTNLLEVTINGTSYRVGSNELKRFKTSIGDKIKITSLQSKVFLNIDQEKQIEFEAKDNELGLIIDTRGRSNKVHYSKELQMTWRQSLIGAINE